MTQRNPNQSGRTSFVVVSRSVLQLFELIFAVFKNRNHDFLQKRADIQETGGSIRSHSRLRPRAGAGGGGRRVGGLPDPRCDSDTVAPDARRGAPDVHPDDARPVAAVTAGAASVHRVQAVATNHSAA